MTIAVSVKVHDGIVLASDSATTLMNSYPDGKQEIVNVWNNQNKIFNIFKGLPIGGITFGAGNIGHPSISTLTKDLRARFEGKDPNHSDWHIDPQNYTMQVVAEHIHEFLYKEHYLKAFENEATPPSLGFRVAGYSAGAPLSELWEIMIDKGKCAGPVLLQPAEITGLFWAGEPEAISRLVLGHSQLLPDVLLQMGVLPDMLPGAIAAVQSGVKISLCEPPMPIQDAIDLAEFLVYVTIMFTRFKPGAGTVGGPIEIAAITKHEGFKWVKRKHYFNSELNPPLYDYPSGGSHE